MDPNSVRKRKIPESSANDPDDNKRRKQDDKLLQEANQILEILLLKIDVNDVCNRLIRHFDNVDRFNIVMDELMNAENLDEDDGKVVGVSNKQDGSVHDKSSTPVVGASDVNDIIPHINNTALTTNVTTTTANNTIGVTGFHGDFNNYTDNNDADNVIKDINHNDANNVIKDDNHNDTNNGFHGNNNHNVNDDNLNNNFGTDDIKLNVLNGLGGAQDDVDDYKYDDDDDDDDDDDVLVFLTDGDFSSHQHHHVVDDDDDEGMMMTMMAKLEEDIVTLQGIFLDVDLGWLRERLSVYGNRPDRVQLLSSELVENPKYPKKQITKDNKETKPPPLPTKEKLENLRYTVEEFLIKYPNPFELFYDAAKGLAAKESQPMNPQQFGSLLYKSHCYYYLMKRFKYTKTEMVRDTFRISWSYALAHRRLLQEERDRFSDADDRVKDLKKSEEYINNNINNNVVNNNNVKSKNRGKIANTSATTITTTTTAATTTNNSNCTSYNNNYYNHNIDNSNLNNYYNVINPFNTMSNCSYNVININDVNNFANVIKNTVINAVTSVNRFHSFNNNVTNLNYPSTSSIFTTMHTNTNNYTGTTALYNISTNTSTSSNNNNYSNNDKINANYMNKSYKNTPKPRKPKKYLYKRPPMYLKCGDEPHLLFYDELWFVDHELEVKDYMDSRTKERQNKIEEARLNQELMTCVICCDDELLFEEALACPEGHLFCRDCVKRSVEVGLGDGKTRFSCLSSDTCSAHFTTATLQKILPPETLDKILNKMLEEDLQQMQQSQEQQPQQPQDGEELVSCPFCSFMVCIDDGGMNRVLQCGNPECMKESCRLCREPSHIPLRCDELEKNAEVAARTAIEKEMTEAMVRTCHKCGKRFFKEDGCNMMHCPCGAKMCYLCRKPITNYDHFNKNNATCQLHVDNKQLHIDEVKKKVEEAKVKYLADNSGVRSTKFMKHLEKI